MLSTYHTAGASTNISMMSIILCQEDNRSISLMSGISRCKHKKPGTSVRKKCKEILDRYAEFVYTGRRYVTEKESYFLE